jgi:hypothetical protein
MRQNQAIYEHCIRNNQPVVILEVGSLTRGVTWKVSFNHINAHGIFGNTEPLDQNRPKKLNLKLQPLVKQRKDSILIACQNSRSLSWQLAGCVTEWLQNTTRTVRQYTDRPIIIRPHPRSPLRVVKVPGATIEQPTLISGTYDSFDIDYCHHCVINYNSGPSVQAAIAGVPVICDASSLAYEISDTMENIESINLKPREDWFLKLCHTEWTVEEIETGIPLQRLLSTLVK